MQILGYSVADTNETLEFLTQSWYNYFQGNASIDDVVADYDKNGFDANQDLPGNMKWEELYEASPKGTKVILTIRDNEDVWYSSWSRFMKQEAERMSIAGLSGQTLIFKLASQIFSLV